MGYNTNRLDHTLADVVGTDETYRYVGDDYYDPSWDWDWDYDYDEPDEIIDWEPEDDYPDYDEPEPEEPIEDDPHEHLPFTGKVSPAACLGTRVQRPGCRCCGGMMGVRRAWRRTPKFNDKPKRKDHRS